MLERVALTPPTFTLLLSQSLKMIIQSKKPRPVRIRIVLRPTGKICDPGFVRMLEILESALIAELSFQGLKSAWILV